MPLRQVDELNLIGEIIHIITPYQNSENSRAISALSEYCNEWALSLKTGSPMRYYHRDEERIEALRAELNEAINDQMAAAQSRADQIIRDAYAKHDRIIEAARKVVQPLLARQ